MLERSIWPLIKEHLAKLGNKCRQAILVLPDPIQLIWTGIGRGDLIPSYSWLDLSNHKRNLRYERQKPTVYLKQAEMKNKRRERAKRMDKPDQRSIVHKSLDLTQMKTSYILNRKTASRDQIKEIAVVSDLAKRNIIDVRLRKQMSQHIKETLNVSPSPLPLEP